jgi:DNA-binding CsgD family transcriptional regulator
MLRAHRVYSVARPSGAFTYAELELVRTLQPLLVTMDRQAAVLGRLPARRPTGEPLLTGRELAVLTLLAEGLTAAAIGRRLGITPRTVTKHLEHLYAKLDVTNRVTAVVVAQRTGLLPDLSDPGSRGAGGQDQAAQPP